MSVVAVAVVAAVAASDPKSQAGTGEQRVKQTQWSQ